MDGKYSWLTILLLSGSALISQRITGLELSAANLGEIFAIPRESIVNTTILEVTRAGITSIEATALAGLPQLEEINLYHNNISELPKDVFNWNTRLKYINMSENNITHLNVDTLAFLEELELFDIGSNQLQFIPRDLFRNNGNLKIMLLFNNRIKRMHSRSLGRLKSLEEFYMAFNELTSFASELFRHNVNLQKIDLSSNKLGHIHEHAFHQLLHLREINLDRNLLRAIPEELFWGNRELRSINLAHNGIAFIPAQLLANVADLELFSVAGNQIATLDAALFAPLKALHYLNVADNRLDQIPFSRTSLPHLLSIAFARNSMNCSYISALVDEFTTDDVETDAFDYTADKDLCADELAALRPTLEPSTPFASEESDDEEYGSALVLKLRNIFIYLKKQSKAITSIHLGLD